MRLRLTYLAGAAWVLGMFSHGAHASYPPLPAFPGPSVEDDSDRATIEELRAASQAGDGWATLRLAGRLTCDREEAQCVGAKRELVALAAEQGEPAAPAVLRAMEAEWRSLAPRGDAVCDQVRDNAHDLLRDATAVTMPGYGPSPRVPDAWEVGRGLSEDGAILYGAAAGPVSLGLVYENDSLKLARISVTYLEIGSFEVNGSGERWEAARSATGRIAQMICPAWSGLDAAAQEYFDGAIAVWPPRGVAAEAPSAWLFATGVAPDLFWLDFYVDPRHDPTTTSMRWSFEEYETFALTELVHE